MFARALDSQAARFAADVRHDLSKPQKELHSKYLYDDLGSALFEVITLLPEYGLTRADERLLCHYAYQIARKISAPAIVAELGSGSGRKTRPILEALSRKGATTYYPIDVSAAALHNCRNELGTIDSVQIVDIQGTYIDGLKEVTARRIDGEALLVLFLGSTIGNFERAPGEDFLRQVRSLLEPGDALLLGTDLIKPVHDLLAAYDDSLGVTAAFNLNLLGRINRELGANFRLDQFRHEARFNQAESRVEMHLRSTVAQTVTIPAACMEVSFREDETIWTESSRKFSPAEVRELARNTGFVCEEQWVDKAWPFAENLFRVEIE